MGDLMRQCLGIVTMVIVAVAARNVSGQANTNGRNFQAGRGAEVVLASLAQARIATTTCGVGDPETLNRVIAAVDRRYRFCVDKDASWSSLIGDFKQDELDARAQGSSRSLGTFGFESFLRTRGAEAQAKGAEAYCSSLPWKMLLEPGAATEAAKAEYMQANPKATLDIALSMFGWILNLGRDTAWVEAPCDKDFWPEYLATKK
jgi:hypothetical protein